MSTWLQSITVYKPYTVCISVALLQIGPIINLWQQEKIHRLPCLVLSIRERPGIKNTDSCEEVTYIQGFETACWQEEEGERVVNLPARVGVWKKTLQAVVEDMTEALQQP